MRRRLSTSAASGSALHGSHRLVCACIEGPTASMSVGSSGIGQLASAVRAMQMDGAAPRGDRQVLKQLQVPHRSCETYSLQRVLARYGYRPHSNPPTRSACSLSLSAPQPPGPAATNNSQHASASTPSPLPPRHTDTSHFFLAFGSGGGSSGSVPGMGLSTMGSCTSANIGSSKSETGGVSSTK